MRSHSTGDSVLCRDVARHYLTAISTERGGVLVGRGKKRACIPVLGRIGCKLNSQRNGGLVYPSLGFACEQYISTRFKNPNSFVSPPGGSWHRYVSSPERSIVAGNVAGVLHRRRRRDDTGELLGVGAAIGAGDLARRAGAGPNRDRKAGAERGRNEGGSGASRGGGRGCCP